MGRTAVTTDPSIDHTLMRQEPVRALRESPPRTSCSFWDLRGVAVLVGVRVPLDPNVVHHAPPCATCSVPRRRITISKKPCRAMALGRNTYEEKALPRRCGKFPGLPRYSFSRSLTNSEGRALRQR